MIEHHLKETVNHLRPDTPPEKRTTAAEPTEKL